MPGLRPDCQPCPIAERPAALALLYRRVPAAFRPRLVADALAEAERGRIDLSGLWIALNRGKIVASLLTQPLAGKAFGVWPPEVLPFWSHRLVAVSLIRAALDDMSRRGYRVAQALVDRSSPRSASGDLIRGGMPRVTYLTYLARSTTDPQFFTPSQPRFCWISYDEASDREFRDVLSATYEGSLDMPELEGVRSLDDVIASHRAAGRFDGSRWQLGRLEGEPSAAAIVLLTDQPDRGAWEVAYLGLTPPARGRGLGLQALGHALEMTGPHAPRLELAVDARNKPAAILYQRAGFLPFDHRAVHLKVLNGQERPNS